MSSDLETRVIDGVLCYREPGGQWNPLGPADEHDEDGPPTGADLSLTEGYMRSNGCGFDRPVGSGGEQSTAVKPRAHVMSPLKEWEDARAPVKLHRLVLELPDQDVRQHVEGEYSAEADKRAARVAVLRDYGVVAAYEEVTTT